MTNHWWQVTFYVTARGLTTSPIPAPDGLRTFEIEFDFLRHRLIVTTSEGQERTLPLSARPVAEFYSDYMATLRALGVDVRLYPVPVEMERVIPFPLDRTHAAYDPVAATYLHRTLVLVDGILKEFRARFTGKCSPVHFWWGAFDLSCTRFSGRRAPVHPGGVPHCPDRVQVEAYSHECISAGWWPGTPGGPIEEPAFYAYAYPEPKGFRDTPAVPAGARYQPELGEFVLPYEAARVLRHPREATLEFLENTYGAAAQLAGWDREALTLSG